MRNAIRLTVIAVLFWTCSLAQLAVAQVDEPGATRLVVGTREVPPFASRDAAGRWRGISIDLWDELARELGLTYEIRAFGPLTELLEAVRTGEVDAGVAAITVTADRESRMDFSHPFYTTGFGIAVRPVGGGDEPTSAARLISRGMLKTIGWLALILAVIGSMVALAERRANPDQFGGTLGQSLWSGFWWAAVTMTTVGYGDKAAKTVLGRVLSLVWMFAALFLIGTFIASMTTALTVGQLGGPIRGESDLVNARVATLEGSTSEAYLRQNRVSFRPFADIVEALEAVADGAMDAAVYDHPMLEYQAAHILNGRVEVLRDTFDREDYAIALPIGSPLRKPINEVLLSDRMQSALHDILFRHLKEAPPPPARPEA